MQVYVMFMIINYIKPRIGKLILDRFIGNNFPEFYNELLQSYVFQTDARKWLFGTLLLDSQF